MRILTVLAGLATIALGLAGCNGGSSHNPGMTDPATPPSTDSVSGTVTYKGAPLTGATVTLWITNSNAVVSTATTDANGNYSFSGLSTSGDVSADYNIWASKAGYGFYPVLGSANPNAAVERYDHTGQFIESLSTGVPMYFTVINFISLANASLTSANFLAYDGTNPPVTVGATGQSQSYASGDDGALKKGAAWPSTRFVDNQNGTVTDNLTGLIWLKNASCFTPAVWATAIADANQLASGQCGLTDGSKAGDWRLPNLVEFESAIDVSVSNPALTAGSPFTNAANILYWTSTGYYGGELGTATAWAIGMSDGRYINDNATNLKTVSQNGVWAVKGTSNAQVKLPATGLFQPPLTAGDDGTLEKGVGLNEPRFVDNGNGTVTDTMTGLVWLKQANCIQSDWANALSQVNLLASGQCGLTDGSEAGSWRMPNRKEMQSLADRNQNNEADYFNFTFQNLSGTVFQTAILLNDILNQYYWTSTTDAANTAEAWTVYSCDFGVYDISKSDVGYSLAVR
jgi:hypothetical protein